MSLKGHLSDLRSPPTLCSLHYLSPHGVVEPRRARRRPPLRAGGGAHPAARVVVALVPAPVARLEPTGVVEGGGPVTMVHIS